MYGVGEAVVVGLAVVVGEAVVVVVLVVVVVQFAQSSMVDPPLAAQSAEVCWLHTVNPPSIIQQGSSGAGVVVG